MKTEVKSENSFTNPFNVATVVDNQDPQYNYRIKVRIPILHDNIMNEYLPWATKVDGSLMGFGGTVNFHSVPEIGSKVLVLFVNNDFLYK